MLIDGGGERKNNNKTRLDLLPSFAEEQYARVMTYGSTKYAEWNWARGMKWTTVIASLKRHVLAIENGEDYDKETGILHSAHIMCNAAFFTEYYKICPQFDDRHKFILPRIGLDIDGVLADFAGHYCSLFGLPEATTWNFDRQFGKRFNALKTDKEFWVSIPIKTKPNEIPFEPVCYITDRPIPQHWTEEWLDKNGFPAVPVEIVNGTSKIEIAKKHNLAWFVDDRYDNYLELNEAGICCFLFDCTRNQRYDVGFKRIKSLKELIK